MGKEQVTRREFLLGVAIAAAGVAITACARKINTSGETQTKTPTEPKKELTATTVPIVTATAIPALSSAPRVEETSTSTVEEIPTLVPQPLTRTVTATVTSTREPIKTPTAAATATETKQSTATPKLPEQTETPEPTPKPKPEYQPYEKVFMDSIFRFSGWSAGVTISQDQLSAIFPKPANDYKDEVFGNDGCFTASGDFEINFAFEAKRAQVPSNEGWANGFQFRIKISNSNYIIFPVIEGKLRVITFVCGKRTYDLKSKASEFNLGDVGQLAIQFKDINSSQPETLTLFDLADNQILFQDQLPEVFCQTGDKLGFDIEVGQGLDKLTLSQVSIKAENPSKLKRLK